MYKTQKFLIIFISLIGIGFCICGLAMFYPLPVITAWIHDILKNYPWVSIIPAVCSLALALVFAALLLAALFMPGRSRLLIMPKSRGRLIFSQKTVESTIRYSFQGMDGIGPSRISVKFHKRPEKTKVKVKLYLTHPNQIMALTEAVQNRIASALKESLGFTAQSIVISIKECNPDESFLERVYNPAGAEIGNAATMEAEQEAEEGPDTGI